MYIIYGDRWGVEPLYKTAVWSCSEDRYGKEKGKKKYIKNVDDGSVYKKTQKIMRRTESKKIVLIGCV